MREFMIKGISVCNPCDFDEEYLMHTAFWRDCNDARHTKALRKDGEPIRTAGKAFFATALIISSWRRYSH